MNTEDALLLDGLLASSLVGFADVNQKFLYEVWIAIRTDGIPDTPETVTVIGDGTKENPYDGSTARKMDALLSQLRSKTHIHLGVGIFRTGGGGGNSQDPKWIPKSGQKISGAGVYQTTLLLTIGSVTLFL